LVIVTGAPGKTAPDVSVTVPLIVPVVVNCALHTDPESIIPALNQQIAMKALNPPPTWQSDFGERRICIILLPPMSLNGSSFAAQSDRMARSSAKPDHGLL
jgi:hypothetical protein